MKEQVFYWLDKLDTTLPDSEGWSPNQEPWSLRELYEMADEFKGMNRGVLRAWARQWAKQRGAEASTAIHLVDTVLYGEAKLQFAEKF